MADIAFEKDLKVAETGIGGLKVVDLAVHGDSRGWFKENWQRAKMTALGIPDLRGVQNNISYNDSRGVTRGIHAEPWDKFISVARGSVFGAWVDLREGSATYGKVFTCTLDPSKAIYVPRGVGNSFQALEDGTAYTSTADLIGKTVVAEAGSAGETTITENADLSQADFISKAVQTDCLMEVAAGTADAAILDLTLASAMIGEGTAYASLRMVDALNVEEYGVAFRKGSDVAEAVDNAFDELKADGTMQALADKYGLTLAE